MKAKLDYVFSRPALTLILIVGLAALLRLIWPLDIEYKYDEWYMFNVSQTVGVSQPWPWLGMASGVSLRNPGMSEWIFVALARLFSITTPVGLSQAVMVINVLAFAVLLHLIYRVVRPEEREPWLWAAALAAVNEGMIQLSRKIWTLSVFPILTVLLYIFWWRRSKKGWAFAWGFLGACLGQIHMSGFFFAGALFLWTVLFEKRLPGKNTREKTRWGYWFLGSFIAALPLIPWVIYALSGHAPLSGSHVANILKLEFWQNWIRIAFGLEASYSLGHIAMMDFIRQPTVVGVQTWLGGIAYGVSLIAGLISVLFGARSIRRRMRADQESRLNLLVGAGSSSAFVQNAAFWGFGILLTASTMTIHRHYLMIAFPLALLWVARLALSSERWGRKVLSVLFVSQLLMSILFLTYIHTHRGSAGGDYGVAYRWQKR